MSDENFEPVRILKSLAAVQLQRVYSEFIQRVNVVFADYKITYSINDVLHWIFKANDHVYRGSFQKIRYFNVQIDTDAMSRRYAVSVLKQCGDRECLQVTGFEFDEDKGKKRADIAALYSIFCTVFWEHAVGGKLSALFVERTTMKTGDAYGAVGGYYHFERGIHGYIPSYPFPNPRHSDHEGFPCRSQGCLKDTKFIVRFDKHDRSDVKDLSLIRSLYEKDLAIIDKESKEPEEEPEAKKAKTVLE